MAPPRLKLPNKKAKDSVKLVDLDDYLEVSDSHEESMGKHRVGDPKKALRFADRALDVYSQGLAKFPRSFDLAYNKARLELEKANDPMLSSGLDVPVLSALRQALSSHRYARDLDPTHTDTLFNMGQVLTSMAEIIAQEEPEITEAIKNIDESLELQSQCFELQRAGFEKSWSELKEAIRETAENQIDNAQTDNVSTFNAQNDCEEEQWVTIEEPVTAVTLLETVMSQIETLTLLCSILTSSLVEQELEPLFAKSLLSSIIDSHSARLLTQILPRLVSDHRKALGRRLSEVILSSAIFTSHYLGLSFRLRIIDVEKYKQQLDHAFTQPELDAASQDVLTESARALLSFNSALADLSSAGTLDDPGSYAALRWNVLVEAQSRLASVAGMPRVEKHAIATTHMMRGDISLLLQVLAYPPTSHQQAITTTPQLLKYAEVYYRNAAKLFGTLRSQGTAEEEKSRCELKGAIVGVLQQVTTTQGASGSSSGQGNSGTIGGMPASSNQVNLALGPGLKAKGLQWVRDQLTEMVIDGLIIPEVFQLDTVLSTLG